MTVAARKQAERARRKERGEVALSGWLSASDHEALSAMAREAGMTQAQVVGRLIGMVGAVRGLSVHEVEMVWDGDWTCMDVVIHSDLTAAVGLGK
jgi:hypothetical protein